MVKSLALFGKGANDEGLSPDHQVLQRVAKGIVEAED